MGTAFVIFILLALCGFIAYVGDLLGRRLGKKRLSVFGMRPKHTAILLTVVTGVVIAAVTFGAALATMPWFRNVVVQGERLSHLNQQIRAQNRGLERQNGQFLADNQRLTGSNQELAGENKNLLGKNDLLCKQNAKLQADSAKLQSEYKSLERLNGELKGRNSGLLTVNARLTGENSRLLGQRNTLNREVTLLATESKDLKDQRYIFRRGEQIASQPILPNPPVEVLQKVATDLVFQALQKSVRPSARQPQVRLVRPEGFPKKDASNAEVESWVAGRAAGVRDQPLVMRIIAEENSVEGRPVRVRLDWYANSRVFTRGQVIAERRVDGAAPTGEVLDELILFLRSDVRRKAMAPPNGMVPSEEGLGKLSYDQLLEVCGEVNKIKGPARVVARARQDTAKAGPLNVDLEVSPVAGPQAERR
jgi:uncharacterized protein (DUF3084 family)